MKSPSFGDHIRLRGEASQLRETARNLSAGKRLPDNWILISEVKVYTGVPFLCTSSESSNVQKSILLAAIQKEIQRPDLSYFVDEPPPVAQGGRGVVVSGCRACRKRINTISQFLDHLTNDALPPLIDRLAAGNRQ